MTAMTWNALIHSYMQRLLSEARATHARNELFDMCHRRVRQHAMTEIEDKRSSFEIFQYAIDRISERVATDQKRDWIEIALNRFAALHLVARKSEINGPVEPHCIDRDIIDVPLQSACCAARKTDEPRIRYARSDRGDDASTGFNTAAIEFTVRQYACPSVEYLHGVDAGLKLAGQI